jgi:hypothetical protein
VTSEDQAHDADAVRDEDAVARFAQGTLQENLHRAVDGVLSSRFQDQRVREALAAELFRAIDPVVRDYVFAERIGKILSPVSSSAPPPARSIEEAMTSLKAKLQTVFAERQPGTSENRASMRERASSAMGLAPSVVDSLRTFVHDAAAFERAQEAASVVMSRYMHPFMARQVVSFAAAAVRTAAQESDEGAETSADQGEEQAAHPGSGATDSSSGEGG